MPRKSNIKLNQNQKDMINVLFNCKLDNKNGDGLAGNSVGMPNAWEQRAYLKRASKNINGRRTTMKEAWSAPGWNESKVRQRLAKKLAARGQKSSIFFTEKKQKKSD